MHDKSTRERTIEDHLVKETQRRNGMALKLRPHTNRGFPDRTVILPGSWVAFVEIKRPQGGRTTKQQNEWGERLHKIGHRFYIVSTFKEVDTIFTDYEQKTKFIDSPYYGLYMI